jgi:hypothetical protein
MRKFVSQAMSAVWEAYDRYAAAKELSKADEDTKSWLYDAACLLEIPIHDKRMLSIYDDYYTHDERLPWNIDVSTPDDEMTTIDYAELFAIWKDCSPIEKMPSEALSEVMAKNQLYGDTDLSFKSFCLGWEKALKTTEDVK